MLTHIDDELGLKCVKFIV